MALVLGRVAARNPQADWPCEAGEEDVVPEHSHDDVLRRYIGEDAVEDTVMDTVMDTAAADCDADADVSAWWCMDSPPAASTASAADIDVGPRTSLSPSASPTPESVSALASLASLHCAVFRQDQASVDRLLAAGADPDEPDYTGSGDTPLMQAVTNGHLGIVRSLCAAGCCVDARRVNGQSPLMLCVVSRTSRRSPRLLLQLLEVLLAAGADPGVREKLRGQTALHALAKLVAADPAEPHLLTALRLLAQRAQQHGVNAQDHRRRTALHHLASRGCANPEPYEILLEARADAALQNARGDTPLVEFLENVGERVEHGDDVVRLLSGPDVSRRHTQYGESPLHVAARRNRPGAVRIALASGADPGHQDLRGNTAMHLAASRGYTEVVSLLLAASGCQVNAVNRDGHTPLHVAVESGFVDVVNTLLRAEGVEVGPSVLELAQQEYRLRAQPQLARTLACELDRRSSRTSLSLCMSSSSRPPSACSFSTTASSSTLGATPQRSPSRRTLADDEDRHPINYLGAQVSCTSRVRPRYSSSDLLAEGEAEAEGCYLPCALRAQRAQWPRPQGPQPVQAKAGSAPKAHDEQLARANEVDESLREAAELMQKLCDEDLSASPPADWSPPISRMRAGQAALPPRAGAGDATPPARLRPSDVDHADPRCASSTESRRSSRSSRSSRRMSSDSTKSKTEQSSQGSSRKFHLPVNPYATIRGCAVEDADEDTSDYLVESLLAVAKSFTDPQSQDQDDLEQGAGPAEQFDRTVDIPKDYELFERSVLFGGSATAVQVADGRALGARVVLSRPRVSDTAIASR